MKKQIISLFLVILFIVSSVPFSVFPVSAESLNGTCGAEGDNLSWTFDAASGVLTISGTGNMVDSTLPTNKPWYSCQNDIKSVVIENGVTSVGVGAFYNCTSLTDVIMPDSITMIDFMAFSYCTALTNITLPDHPISIGFQVFSPTAYSRDDNNWENGCLLISNHLVQVNKNKSDNCTVPKSTKYIESNSFSDCYYLKSVTIGNSVTSIGSFAFNNCSALTEVIISKSVKSISGYAFDDCPKLTTIYYTGTEKQWNDISITDKNDTFLNANIVFNYIPEEEKTIISGTCSDNLTWTLNKETCTLTISGNGDINDYHAGYTTPWYEMREFIKTLIIEDDVTGIGEFAFDSCENLTSVTVGRGVKHIENWAFQNCNLLTKVNYKKDEHQWYDISIGVHNAPLFNANIVFNYIPVVYGDVNGDGRVTITDVLKMRKYIAGIDTDESGGDYAAADVNGDTRVTITDVLLVRKYIAGIITEFPAEQ